MFIGELQRLFRNLKYKEISVKNVAMKSTGIYRSTYGAVVVFAH